MQPDVPDVGVGVDVCGFFFNVRRPRALLAERLSHSPWGVEPRVAAAARLACAQMILVALATLLVLGGSINRYYSRLRVELRDNGSFKV